MNKKIRLLNDISRPVVWMVTGILAWTLSGYLFSFALSPLLIKGVRVINAMTGSMLVREFVNMLFLNFPKFLLSFIFALILSFAAQYTRFRLILYILGEIAIGFYLAVEHLMGNVNAYSELPSWVIPSSILEFVALLFLIPICAIAGSKVGTKISRGGRSSSKPHA